MRALFGLIINVNKDSSLKAKARTKDSSFVLKDIQGPRTRTTSLAVSLDMIFSRWIGRGSCADHHGYSYPYAFCCIKQQENLANAKVSGRQPRYTSK